MKYRIAEIENGFKKKKESIYKQKASDTHLYMHMQICFQKDFYSTIASHQRDRKLNLKL